MEIISIVVPVYKCSSCLEKLYKLIENTFKKHENLDFRLVLVNDGSPDDSWETIKYLCENSKKVKGINLSRNFGQHNAITAGLEKADGEWTIVMDCDLQDNPEEIPLLHEFAVTNGFDAVFARRVNRKDNWHKKFFSRSYYKFFDFLTENKTDGTTANFGIYSNKVITNYLRLKEHNRLFPVLVRWLGFEIGYLDVEHKERFDGESSYSFGKLMALGLDNLAANSVKPLKFFTYIGFFISFLSIIYGFFIIIKYFLFTVPVQGWTSLMVSIYFLCGLIMSMIGVTGLYIGKIFNEVKERPLYVVKEDINCENDA